MGVLRRVRARLRGLFHRDAVAGEIREELEFHVRMRAEELERAGAAPPAAVEQARRRFGNLALWQDAGYDVRGGGVMETIVQDLRYGIRLLIRQPGFSLVAIATLALGIGITTAVASVIDAAMLHPLPYPHPEELVELSIDSHSETDRSGRPSHYGPALVDVEAIRTTPNAPLTVSMWRNLFHGPVADGPEPERLRGMEIDHQYLALFGVTPIRGRAFRADDMRAGAPGVAMIGYGYWQRRFGGRDDAIGQRLRLDDESVEIVGIVPRTFNRTTSLYVPLTIAPQSAARRGTGVVTYGRLRPGLTLDRAERDLTPILAAAPVTNLGGGRARLQTLLARETYGYWTTANILLGSVALILLIACVNVAGLLLARGATRTPELAIRAAIGAGRARIVRQLLTESLLLAVIGGTLGVVIAGSAIDALVANIPLPVSSNAPAALNWRVLSFSLVLALGTGVLFGFAPAIQLSGARVPGMLAKSGRRGGSALSTRGGQWLIGVEVTLALVLVTGAGLMIRSFSKLVSTDLGFQPESIVTVEAMPTDLKSTVFDEYYATLLDRLRQMPDVARAGAINHLPLMGSATYAKITIDGADKFITLLQVLPDYFQTLGLAPVSGRFVDDSDRSSERLVAVVGQRAARHLFPDGDVLGRSFTLFRGRDDTVPVDVVGIAPDVKVDGADSTMPETDEVFVLYRPALGVRPEPLVVVVRPRGATVDLADRLRQTALHVGPRAMVERVRAGTDWLDDTVVTPRRRTVLLSLLGVLGLVLTLVGVFGMTAYAVARRTQEIGVRMAFGARPSDVVRTMIGDAAKPIAIGIGAGLAGSWVATRAIATFLFHTTPTDAPTFAAAAIAMAAAGFIAVWIPARRAARVDPVQSLRVE